MRTEKFTRWVSEILLPRLEPYGLLHVEYSCP